MREGGEVVLRWPRSPRSVPLARRELRCVLEQWGWSQVEDTACLVLTELLTNAVRHAGVRGREIETRFLRAGGVLRVEVHDASEKKPLTALQADSAEGGRGLPLIEALSAAWGTSERNGPGKSVWAELPVDGTRRWRDA
ncbi:ATP-binding protein [Streptomyces sp. NPDC059247]|uniref:ATP-binding protein n=1 Tax=Streptomyces sp. NPDC059247 TaxID=3346790 RepID=UPI003689D115